MSDVQRVGSLFGGLGTTPPFTAGISGAQRNQDAHARFMDAVLAGRVFMGGGPLVAITNATFTVATTGATATPIIGLWNPSSNTKNAVIWQATLAVIMTALQATGPGGFNWVASAGNAGITLGAAPFNALTLVNTGSSMKVFGTGTALTGLTTTLANLRGSALGGGSSYNAALLGTAAGFQTQQVTGIENIDGGIIVPPGGVLALLANTTPVAHSVVPGLIWEEVPLITYIS